MPPRIVFSPGGMDVRNWLKQFIKKEWLEQLQFPLTDDNFVREMKTLSANMTDAVISATDTYEVPNTHVGLLMGVWGHVRIRDISAETLGITGIGNPDVRDRLMLKAMNTQVKLENADKTKAIVGGSQGGGGLAVLADIYPIGGGEKLKYDNIPHVVGPGEVLEMTASQGDDDDNVFGSNGTDVGLNLDFVLLRIGR